MNKSILLGIIVLGGILLIGVALSNPDGDSHSSEDSLETEVASIPADLLVFPIYPNTTLVNIRDTDGDEARDVSLSLSSSGSSIKEINEWYRSALTQNGWNIKSDKNVAGYQIIQGEKENLYTSMQAAGGEDGVNISQHIKIRK